MTTLAHDLGLIPPGRLGPLAAEARSVWGMSLNDVSQATGDLVSTVELRLLESGRLSLSEEQIRALFKVLAISTEEILPVRVRLEIDTSQGRLVAGGSVATMLPDATDAQILHRYLCLVYALRRVRAGTFVVPRADDLDVLATSLGAHPAEVRLRLEHLMRHRRDDLRLGVRALAGRAALPGLGLLVGVTALGALLLVEAQPLGAAPLPSTTMSAPGPVSGGPASTGSKVGSRHGSVDIGTPLVIERQRPILGPVLGPVLGPTGGADAGATSGDSGVVLSLVRSGPPADGSDAS